MFALCNITTAHAENTPVSSLSNESLAKEYAGRLKQITESTGKQLLNFQRMLSDVTTVPVMTSEEKGAILSYLTQMEVFADTGDPAVQGTYVGIMIAMIESYPAWPHDKCKIKLYALRAAFNGSGPAANALATMHKRGILFPQNIQKAKLWSLEAERRNPFFERSIASMASSSKEDI